jgi:hypothetical protein
VPSSPSAIYFLVLTRPWPWPVSPSVLSDIPESLLGEGSAPCVAGLAFPIGNASLTVCLAVRRYLNSDRLLSKWFWAPQGRGESQAPKSRVSRPNRDRTKSGTSAPRVIHLYRVTRHLNTQHVLFLHASSPFTTCSSTHSTQYQRPLSSFSTLLARHITMCWS